MSWLPHTTILSQYQVCPPSHAVAFPSAAHLLDFKQSPGTNKSRNGDPWSATLLPAVCVKELAGTSPFSTVMLMWLGLLHEGLTGGSLLTSLMRTGLPGCSSGWPTWLLGPTWRSAKLKTSHLRVSFAPCFSALLYQVLLASPLYWHCWSKGKLCCFQWETITMQWEQCSGGEEHRAFSNRLTQSGAIREEILVFAGKKAPTRKQPLCSSVELMNTDEKSSPCLIQQPGKQN